MSNHPIERDAVVTKPERTSPPYIDPVVGGWKKFTSKWLSGVLSRTSSHDEDELNIIGDKEVELVELWEVQC